MLLEQVKGIKPDLELQEEFDKVTEQINVILDEMALLIEAPGNAAFRLQGGEQGIGEPSISSPDNEMGDNRMPAPGQVQGGESMDEVLAAMDQVMKQMDAAKRGLGFVNKLSAGDSKNKNRSRVMGNMNRIRGNVRRIEKMLAAGMG